MPRSRTLKLIAAVIAVAGVALIGVRVILPTPVEIPRSASTDQQPKYETLTDVQVRGKTIQQVAVMLHPDLKLVTCQTGAPGGRQGTFEGLLYQCTMQRDDGDECDTTMTRVADRAPTIVRSTCR